MIHGQKKITMIKHKQEGKERKQGNNSAVICKVNIFGGTLT